MEYVNPQPPEGINVATEHPLREFAWLLGAVALSLGLVMTVLLLFADSVAGLVPFSTERKVVARYVADEPATSELQQYLAALTHRVSQASDLPPGMSITVHIDDSDDVNAFATLGGHVWLMRGLLERSPSEEALAAVLAHEIGHIKYRHPIHAVSRAMVVGIVLSAVSVSAGNHVIDGAIGQGANLALLKYSRDGERDADALAMHVLRSLYGSTTGASEMFEMLAGMARGPELPEILSTHPILLTRLQAAERVEGSPHGRSVRLPDAFKQWLNAQNNTPR